MTTSEQKLRAALKRFADMVEDDKILVTAEHRMELIETLRQANEALEHEEVWDNHD